MSFDMDIWHKTAEQHQVGSVAIQVSIALNSIQEAISKIAKKADVDVAAEIKEIDLAANQLSEMFDDLTGYERDENAG